MIYEVKIGDSHRAFRSVKDAECFAKDYRRCGRDVTIVVYPRPSTDEEFVEFINNRGVVALGIKGGDAEKRGLLSIETRLPTFSEAFGFVKDERQLHFEDKAK